MTYDVNTRHRFWNIIRTAKWRDSAFDPEKAFVASIFSEISYEHITDKEIAHGGRMIVVPCLRYYELIRSKNKGDVFGLVRSLGDDLPEPFLVEIDGAVAVGLKIGDLIFVGIRGTRKWYAPDHLINFNFGKRSPFFYDVRVHRGFLKVAKELFNPLSDAIRNRCGNNENNLIYLCGHSMGGGIVAIMHAIWDGGTLSSFFNNIQVLHGDRLSHSAYTFGMPRYTNDRGIKSLRMPHVIAHKSDPIARIPPDSCGYRSCPNPHWLNNAPIRPISLSRLKRSGLSIPVVSDIDNFVSDAASYHPIEFYRQWL